ncbi:MAG: HAD-IIIC family phosphatase [Oscillospiraceae bacterium]|nr:HAD-IIIC family phosphatase [Oscillospiraceae bacterium]
MLQYPFDANTILTKKRSLKRELLQQENLLEKKVAILSGTTIGELKSVLEVFLLSYGIKPVFYEGGYNRFYEDSVFENPDLKEFAPDVIWVNTSFHSIQNLPVPGEDRGSVDRKLEAEVSRFRSVWNGLAAYNCPIIQNNFDLPRVRAMGNAEGWLSSGKVRFVRRLNEAFAQTAEDTPSLLLLDYEYAAAWNGIESFSDPNYYNGYKYGQAPSYIPFVAFQAANIIKSVFGKNKKALFLDLDNTLWGGVIGDDGLEGIKLGYESPAGIAYSDVQQYAKDLSHIGVILGICSKNEDDIARSGFTHPSSLLAVEDFLSFRANWDPKPLNLEASAKELNIGTDSLVFVDDNPAERKIVRDSSLDCAVPELTVPERFAETVSAAGYFEVTSLSKDDLSRAKMYQDNRKREQSAQSFTDYNAYLESLEMRAFIGPFKKEQLERVTQLANKTNQFNLTTRRYQPEEMMARASDPKFITLSGRLEDRFGDNGIVSCIVADQTDPVTWDLELWIMSCRVFKRDLEYAMFDELVKKVKDNGGATITGWYYPTAKNRIVSDYYSSLGFEKEEETENGTFWKYTIPENTSPLNHVIKVVDTSKEE